MLEHDVDADLSHNAIPLRRIYVLNNGNKADDIPRSAHSDHHPAGRIQLPAATAIASEAIPPASERPVARYLLMAVAFVFLVA
ncbi:MAG: hypothetical protein EOQ86_02535 [Mesorhizobium sp.]|nr:MAG: hypothetical protein EOQ85_03525 [Mesorhizobium sp.]RWH87012.1 MAG: hypothetical protein EOQ86_02535 [Mesorhizobium sp.]RWH93450.1 MAG: hypothetical protein EOQ87_02595 [Mesorhizobium sp.]RWI03093.1 MAG: hypothetical protein EOQ88_02535 [Mesorhizobium sp.]RWI05601.1 MAG: hypothetical protein EOQ89_06570 [Mesorhizobium sp.]